MTAANERYWLDLLNMGFIWKSNLQKYVEFHSNFHRLDFEANLIFWTFVHNAVESTFNYISK